MLTFNRGAETITGVPFHLAVGRAVEQVLQLPAAVMQLDRGRRSATRMRGGMNSAIRPDGRHELEIGLTATHLRNAARTRRPAVHVSGRDATSRSWSATLAIQQRLAAVGEMAAGIAHEIRNPLASMSGSIQILRQELPLSAEQEQLMDIVLRESERLNTTIRSFLAYARPQRFQIARFDVRRALNDAALLLRNSAEVREGHAIDVDVPRRRAVVRGRRGADQADRLEPRDQRPARDAGRRAGCGSPARSSRSREGVVLTVRDEGIGIAPEELDALFQPFHGSFAKGSGLGLAIVHRIVTDYNGEIQVSSERGAGTTVSVRLPARAVAVAT